MQNGNKRDGGTVVTQQDGVLEQKQVVSKAILMRVFGENSVPFSLNDDGSVDLIVYKAWLSAVGQEALTALAEASETVSPKAGGLT